MLIDVNTCLDLVALLCIPIGNVTLEVRKILVYVVEQRIGVTIVTKRIARSKNAVLTCCHIYNLEFEGVTDKSPSVIILFALGNFLNGTCGCVTCGDILLTLLVTKIPLVTTVDSHIVPTAYACIIL